MPIGAAVLGPLWPVAPSQSANPTSLLHSQVNIKFDFPTFFESSHTTQEFDQSRDGVEENKTLNDGEVGTQQAPG